MRVMAPRKIRMVDLCDRIVVAFVRQINPTAAAAYQESFNSQDPEAMAAAEDIWMGIVNDLRDDNRIPSAEQVANKAVLLRHLNGSLDEAIITYVTSPQSEW